MPGIKTSLKATAICIGALLFGCSDNTYQAPENTTSSAQPEAPIMNGRVIDVAPVWPGHPVGFALLTTEDQQYVGFYDAERHLVLAQRDLSSIDWTFQTLPQQTGWDSHNYITMAIDQDGHLHVAADMHVTPLVYFRTTTPGDITTLKRVTQMVGDLETHCTYPVFMRDAQDRLIFTYRSGGSGNGNQIYNRYDPTTTTWSRLLDQPLLDGQGKRNAYATTPKRGPDGAFHMVWVWRDTPDAATNHTVSYARSQDLIHWETAAGTPIPLPITLQTGDLVDPVPSHGGVINNNVHVGFDHHLRPIVSYHKYDQSGNTQIINTRWEDDHWAAHQASDWDYRWDFGGGGSIIFELKLTRVHQLSDGRWVQTWDHSQYGKGGWELNPDTLEVIKPYEPETDLPVTLSDPVSDYPGMTVRHTSDLGHQNHTAARYTLRWETLGPYRDQPRKEQLPEAGMLQVIETHHAR